MSEVENVDLLAVIVLVHCLQEQYLGQRQAKLFGQIELY